MALITIPSAYVNAFSANMMLLVEQKASKLRPVFPIEYAHGEKYFFDRLGNFVASEVLNGWEDVVIQDAAHSRRMATLSMYNADTTLANIDQLKMLIDPTSSYVQQLASAHGRNYDQVVLKALVGTAATGQTGSGTQTLPSGNQVAAGGTGLTVAKFNTAIQLLQSFDCPTEAGELVLITNSKGIAGLFGDTTNQLTSFDFVGWTHPMLTGVLGTFRGVQIIRTEQAALVDSTPTYQSILCHKEAARIAMAKDMVVRVDEIPLKGYDLLVHTQMAFGAVRMEENRVIQILHV